MRSQTIHILGVLVALAAMGCQHSGNSPTGNNPTGNTPNDKSDSQLLLPETKNDEPIETQSPPHAHKNAEHPTGTICPKGVTQKSACTTPLHNEKKECIQYQEINCEDRCQGFVAKQFSCKNNQWLLQGETPAQCICTPQQNNAALNAALAQWDTQLVRTIPTPNSTTDQCELTMHCGTNRMKIVCDGENDGTNTSLCSCTYNQKEVRLSKELFSEEAPESCFLAAATCAADAR